MADIVHRATNLATAGVAGVYGVSVNLGIDAVNVFPSVAAQVAGLGILFLAAYSAATEFQSCR